MKDFLQQVKSADVYIHLPRASMPKVILCVSNEKLTSASFDLHRPFSFASRMSLYVIRAFFKHCNSFARFCLRMHLTKEGEFVSYLSSELGTRLHTSIYIATDHRKLVLQILDPRYEVIGFMKISCASSFNATIEKEIYALKRIAAVGLRSEPLMTGYFDGRAYCLTAPVVGESVVLPEQSVCRYLEGFRRNETFLMSEHPRISTLLANAKQVLPNSLVQIGSAAIEDSCLSYALVYEHGDFAPWNVREHLGEIYTFDYEMFVEDGMEYFDLIKYFFSVGYFLLKLRGSALLSFIKQEVALPEFTSLVTMFFLSELIVLDLNESRFLDIEHCLRVLRRDRREF